MEATKEAAAGLEGVVAGRSAITYVDGAAGVLRYRGYVVADLARRRTFEEVTALLWDGELPESGEATRRELTGLRALDQTARDLLEAMATRATPLETLRTIVSSSSATDAGGATDRERAARLASIVHAVVAAIAAARAGRDLPESRPDDTVARYLLRALAGREPTAEEERIFDAVLVLHADHELNASTFAARIVAATEADMTAAVTAAIGALQGPKHGGANEDVAAMLASLDDAASARAWAEAKLARYREMTPEERKRPEARFAGFGHRVYKVDDPRAVVLRELGLAAASDSSARRVADVAEAVREVVQTGLGLPLNVDYYSAVVYVGLGIDPAVYTSIFAASRVVGWCAHVAEQHADNRLIRPRAEYVGPSARSL